MGELGFNPFVQKIKENTILATRSSRGYVLGVGLWSLEICFTWGERRISSKRNCISPNFSTQHFNFFAYSLL